MRMMGIMEVASFPHRPHRSYSSHNSLILNSKFYILNFYFFFVFCTLRFFTAGRFLTE
jgi:hypothetical protein